jgi:signal transduction histidine kinase
VGKGLSWNNATTFAIHAEGTPRALKPGVHEELFYIGRESLNNAFRHARAERIEVILVYGSSELRLVSCDDGCGMEAKLLEEGRSGHWGMPGMRERASRIGATMKCRSAPGAGTEITIIVSARRAYDRAGIRNWLHRFAQRAGRKHPAT